MAPPRAAAIVRREHSRLLDQHLTKKGSPMQARPRLLQARPKQSPIQVFQMAALGTLEELPHPGLRLLKPGPQKVLGSFSQTPGYYGSKRVWPAVRGNRGPVTEPYPPPLNRFLSEAMAPTRPNHPETVKARTFPAQLSQRPTHPTGQPWGWRSHRTSLRPESTRYWESLLQATWGPDKAEILEEGP